MRIFTAFWRFFQKTPDDKRKRLLDSARHSLVEWEAKYEDAQHSVSYLRRRIARLEQQLKGQTP